MAPAGLDLGAVTPEEIAVSILAELVQVRRAQAAAAPSAAAAEPRSRAEARDPVCGMAVAVATARHGSETGGGRVYVCCAGCRAAFDRDPGPDASPA